MRTVAMYVNAEPHSTSSVIPVSWDQVHASKSRILFSRNVHQSAIFLNRKFGLGMPLHHEKVSKATYQFIIDKMDSRLSSWKANTLSLAARHTY